MPLVKLTFNTILPQSFVKDVNAAAWCKSEIVSAKKYYIAFAPLIYLSYAYKCNWDNIFTMFTKVEIHYTSTLTLMTAVRMWRLKTVSVSLASSWRWSRRANKSWCDYKGSWLATNHDHNCHDLCAVSLRAVKFDVSAKLFSCHEISGKIFSFLIAVNGNCRSIANNSIDYHRPVQIATTFF